MLGVGLFTFVLIYFVNSAPIFEDVVLEDFYFNDEFGEHFEGDMLLTVKQHRAVIDAKEERNGLLGGSKRWPNLTVVYYIEEDDFDEDHIKIIEEGMEDIANNSCIKFQPRKNNEHAVTIQGSARGCYSNVGYIANDDEEENQVLNLARGCFKHGTVVHEMLHTLGFFHMQSTYDRDDFVKIVWENIKEGTEHNFAKYNNNTVTDFGIPYDYESVMHYPETAFSKNGNKTIIPLQDGVKIGQRNGLSESDILKLNKMYCDKSNEIEKFSKHTNDRLIVSGASGMMTRKPALHLSSNWAQRYKPWACSEQLDDQELRVADWGCELAPNFGLQ